jgi:DNA-binding winged helix-turn-helix (wHTH) protein
MNSETPDSLLAIIEDGRVAYVFDSFRLVPSEYRLERKDAGHETLGTVGLCVLLVLVRNSKRLVRRKEIFDAVWPGQNSVEDGTLNTQIKLLRELLGDDANSPRFIKTLPGRGFMFLPDVQEEWLDAESEAKAQLRKQSVAEGQKGIPAQGKTQLVGSLWIVDVTGAWHAIWETTAHYKVNINHEVVDFSQDGANITLKNCEASPDNVDGGYLWEARLTLHDNRHMVGAYW